MLGLSPLRCFIVIASVVTGCAGTVPLPAAAPTPLPAAHVATDPVVAPRGELPAAADCATEELSDDDPRCPADVVLAAAMSWLDKTTAVFDGVEMHIVEHDPVEIALEAQGDPEFSRLLTEADTAPRDGVLDGAEARVLESRVLEHIDARHADRYAAR